MPVFLDLNYHQFTNNSLDETLIKYQKNIGYLENIPSDYSVYFLAIADTNTVLKKGNIVYKFFKRSRLKKFEVPLDFHREIKKIKPDFILIHGLRYGFFSTILKKTLPKQTKILVQVHGHVTAPKGFKAMVYRFASQYIDGYIFTGKENAASWVASNIFAREKVFEAMEGGSIFTYDSKSEREPNSFLWVSRLTESKDPIMVIKGFSKFLNLVPTATLTMYYSTNELLNAVMIFLNENEAVKNAIHLEGYIENNALEKVYNRHQYFIQASHFEGSGYALLEAMSCGCVPIASKIPPFDYMLNHGLETLRFEVGNLDEFYAALVKTTSMNYNVIQNKVLAAYNDRLTFKAIAENIINAFQSIDSKSDL